MFDTEPHHTHLTMWMSFFQLSRITTVPTTTLLRDGYVHGYARHNLPVLDHVQKISHAYCWTKWNTSLIAECMVSELLLLLCKICLLEVTMLQYKNEIPNITVTIEIKLISLFHNFYLGQTYYWLLSSVFQAGVYELLALDTLKTYLSSRSW